MELQGLENDRFVANLTHQLKKLKETKGNVTYGDLADYLGRMVPLTSSDINYQEQNPEVNISPRVEENWRNWKLK